MDLFFKKLIFNGSHLKPYSENRPVVLYKANTLYLRKSILKRKKKTQKKHDLIQSWVFLLCLRSVVLYRAWANIITCVQSNPRDLTRLERKRTWRWSVILMCSNHKRKSFLKHCIHTWNWIMQLNCTWINCFLKRFWSLLIVTLQDRQPYKLLFPTYLCVVCQLYLIDNPLEEYKTVGGGKDYAFLILYMSFYCQR